MEFEGYLIPEDLLYTHEHDWLRMDENSNGVVGITDYATKTLNEVVYVDMPSISSDVMHMAPFGSVESVKAVSDLYSPLTGKISKVNDLLRTNPELISQSPYDKGWIIEISPSSRDSEIKALLSPQEYADVIKQLAKK